MKTLELKDICGYLPYGLRIMRPPTNVPVVAELLDIRKDFTILGAGHIDTYRAVLRPMSDLTEEITHKGEKFVPIVELARLHRSCTPQPYEIKTTYYDGIHKKGKWAEHEMRYIEHTSNMGDLSISFGYCEDMDRFYHRDETRKMPLGVACQLQMFDKLSEWMFDYRA